MYGELLFTEARRPFKMHYVTSACETATLGNVVYFII